jgi:uncharacterized protein YkwD
MRGSRPLLIGLALLWTCGLGLCADQPANKNEPKFTPSKEEQLLIDLTNKERDKEGLPPLKPNEKLFKAARDHAANMAKQNLMKHELDGKTPLDRVKAVGYVPSYSGENIAAGFPPAEAIKKWMGSEGHRANILSKDLTEIGVGIGKNLEGKPFYAQVFGSPAKK